MSLVYDPDAVCEFAKIMYRVHAERDSEAMLNHGMFFINTSVRKKYAPPEMRDGVKRDYSRFLMRQFVPMRATQCGDPKKFEVDIEKNTQDFADRFLSHAYRCDFTEGAYTTIVKKDDPSAAPQRHVIPKSAVAFYASLNPHDQVAGTREVMQKFLNWATGADTTGDYTFRPIKQISSAIHRNPCETRRKLVDLDVDTKDEMHIRQLVVFLREYNLVDSIVIIVNTRGGYHVVLPCDALGKNYQKLAAFCAATAIDGEPQWCSIAAKDNVLPLPGTLQGGYPVTIVEVEDFILQ